MKTVVVFALLLAFSIQAAASDTAALSDDVNDCVRDAIPGLPRIEAIRADYRDGKPVVYTATATHEPNAENPVTLRHLTWWITISEYAKLAGAGYYSATFSAYEKRTTHCGVAP